MAALPMVLMQLIAVLPAPAAGGQGGKQAAYTDLGYCWYCGPTCYTTCPWSSFFPKFLALPPHEVNISRDANTSDAHHVSQPPMVQGGPRGELLVQAERVLLHSVDGHSWDVLTPYPGGGPAGVGWLRDGTLLTASFSTAFHITLYRGTPEGARGYSWTGPTKLITNSSIGDFAGGDNSLRFIEDDEGTIFYITRNFDRAPPDETLTYPVVYVSTDRGRTFAPRGQLIEWGSESDILPLGAGNLLAVTRYQTRNCSDSPTFHSSSIGRATGPHYQGTAVLRSSDNGVSWKTDGLVTGFAQQTASIVRVDAETIAIIFSHKDIANGTAYGQRAIFSYDSGNTYSNVILELHHGGMYAASAVLSDGVIVTSFGNTDGQLESLRWRPPPKEAVQAYGSFAPIQIQIPRPAPPPPGYPAPLPQRPLPPVPIKRHATSPNWGYGPPCQAGPSGEYSCMWATYQPIIRPWPPMVQHNHTVRGFIEPPLVAARKLLLSQSGSVIYSSADDGQSFKALCAMPTDTAAGVGGFANGLGLLSDGTLLAARYYTQRIAGSNLTRLATYVYNSKLPSSTGGNCKWSTGFELAPRGSSLNSVGAGLGIRFTEEPVSLSSSGSARGVLIAVRSELTHTVAGVALPKSEQVGAAVIYRSTNSGRTFVAHGSLSDWTSEADLIFPNSTASGRGNALPVVLAAARYQGPTHFASVRYDTGVLTNATAVSYKSTAVFKSTDGGATFGPPGLVTGEGQQSASFVQLSDGALVLAFGHKDAGEGQKFIVSYDGGMFPLPTASLDSIPV